MIKDKVNLIDVSDEDPDSIDPGSDSELEPIVNNKRLSIPRSEVNELNAERQKLYLLYLFLPFFFLTVALLGGLRLSSADNTFVFLKPPLFCMIFAVILLVLFLRAGLIRFDGWFSENFLLTKNLANAAVLLSLFIASAQLFNSLLPEQGLPFWIVAFCFFWTLWNNLFADFDIKKLLRSLGALFGLAFVVKYLILANLTAPESEGWFRGMIENPTKEAFTWLFDLPRFSAGTGYIQFFGALFYLIGLYLLPQTTENRPRRISDGLNQSKG